MSAESTGPNQHQQLHDGHDGTTDGDSYGYGGAAVMNGENDDVNLMRQRTLHGVVVTATPQLPPLVLQTNHLDYIHDIVFDTYGRRMASCSGDRFVKVWDLRGTTTTTTTTTAGASTMDASPPTAAAASPPPSTASTVQDAWTCTSSWQAHRGSVTCLSWCHPEYGTLLATAGLDQEVKIWEERTHANNTVGGGQMMMTAATAPTPSNNNNNSTAASSLWTLRASLAEAKRAVTCVQFAPRHYGLKLATASADGRVRIYEAIDVINVGSWPLSATLHAYGTIHDGAGSEDPDDHHNYHSHRRPGGGGADASLSSSSGASTASSSHWLTLSWCTGRFDPPTLVVGGGTTLTAEASSAALTNSSSGNTANAVVIYRYAETARSWMPLRILPRIASITNNNPSSSSSSMLAVSPALGVAWAPNVGRRYHYVAAAYGNALVVYKLKRALSNPSSAGPTTTGAAGASTGASTGATTIDLELESSQVLPATSAWRCQWNVTGTVLACSGDLGRVQLYKSSPHSGLFELVSEIRHPDPTTTHDA